MALKAFKKLELQDREQTKLQDNVAEFLNQLPKTLLDGVILENIALASASTALVAHKLGRSFQGWIVLDQDGSAIVWRDSASTADNAKFLPLKTSAGVNVKLWVY